VLANFRKLVQYSWVGSEDVMRPAVSGAGYAKRHRTRALILDAALAEASERGLHRASVSGIAARANTAVGNLHYHFGSRAALLRATMQRLMTDFSARLAVVDEQHHDDFFERHRAELLAYVGYVRENPAHIRLVEEIKFLEPQLYRDGVDTWVELLSQRLRAGIANGSVRAMGDDEIVALAHFLVGSRRFLEDLVSEVGRDEQLVDAYLGLVRNGLAAQPREASSDRS
jgi:AcrR family transcriptional regulator